jgi:hypothetical protein
MNMAKTEAVQTVSDVTGGLIIPTKIATHLEKAFDSAYEAYYKKGGIADLKSKLEEAQTGDGSIGNMLLGIGRECLTHTGEDGKAAAALFKGACAQIEHKKREAYADQAGKKPTIQQLLPTWAPSKATVLASLDRGLALNSKDDKGNHMYPGIGAVRTAVRNTNPRQQGGGQQGANAFPAFKSKKLLTVIEMTFKELIVLPEAAQDEAANLLMQWHTQIMEMHRPTTQEAKEVAQAERAAATATLEKQSKRRGTRAKKSEAGAAAA